MLKSVDIQNHTLKTSMSGYNKKDTDEFLASIHESYEAILKENRDLKDKITSLSEGIQYYKQMENTLQKALVLAEKTSSETQEAAKIQADTIIKETEEKAKEIIENAKTETGSIKAETDVFVKESETRAAFIIKEAEEKAKEIISKAEAEALSVKLSAQQEATNIKAKSEQLLYNYEDYREKIKKFALSQLQMLEDKELILHTPEPEMIDKSAGETFSWSSDTHTTVQTLESKGDIESGFTFIDTE